MRLLKFRLVKDNQVVGHITLQPGEIIDIPRNIDNIDEFTGFLDIEDREIYERDNIRYLRKTGYDGKLGRVSNGHPPARVVIKTKSGGWNITKSYIVELII